MGATATAKGRSGMPPSTKPARDAPRTSSHRAYRQAQSEGVDDSPLNTSQRTVDIEHEMAQARPRLLRLARAYGLPLATAQEVVQDTLLEAWRHLDALSDPTGVQLWLNAICRNV